MAYYQDIPLPKRTERQRFPSDSDEKVPEQFLLELILDSESKTLKLSAFWNGIPVFYRGRGYFTERLSDLPGAGFRVAAVGLFDPFLTGKDTVEAKHFHIILRVVVPKLRKEGILLNCDLQMSDEPPIVFHVNWEEKEKAVRLCVTDSVPRESLEPYPDLESYRISGNTLYRLNGIQLMALEAYPAGERLLNAAEWQALLNFHERFPLFFKGMEIFQVKRQLWEREKEQPKNVSSPLDSLFDDITVTKLPQNTGKAPEPRRQTVFRKSEIIELPGPLLESAELSISIGNQMYASRTALFLHDAQRLKNYTVERARFMPFRVGRPTYTDMNPTQRGWYFYWRAEFNRGVLQRTDIAYLYVAIYELLNQVTAVGAEALSKLLRLWEGYREDFPYLDLCMPGWCADFMLLNHLGTDFDAIWERIPFSLRECGIPAELFLNRRLKDGVSALPLSILSRSSEYDICSSRFCESETNRKNVEELVHKALETAERASTEQGTPFLNSFHQRKTQFCRESYYAAMIDRSVSRRITLKYLPLISSSDFQKTLAGILRACENALRRRERFPGRLKEEKLPVYLTDALAPLLEKASQRPTEPKKIKAPVAEERPPQKPLVIDLNRARDLEAQSWENTRRLLEALGENADEIPLSANAEVTENAEVVETAETAETAENTENIANAETLEDTKATANTEITENAKSAENTKAAGSTSFSEAVETVGTAQKEVFAENADIPSENGIFAALSEIAAAVLKALAAGDFAQVRKICTEHMTFPEAIYEEINEAALDAIGDLLLDTASGEIFEDYREMIAAELERI